MECVKGDYKELAVRALNAFRADRQFRTNFGRVMDQITNGDNIQDAFLTNLGPIDIL